MTTLRASFLIAIIATSFLLPMGMTGSASATHVVPDTLSSTNWDVGYKLTTHDGIEITDADYKNQGFINQAHVPYIKVQYHGINLVNLDHLCHDAAVDDRNELPFAPLPTACAALASVTPVETSSSVKITAEFEYTNVYKYVQTWEFLNDGTTKNDVRYYGPGQCPNGGSDNCSTYFFFWRMDYDVKTTTNSFYHCQTGSSGNDWNKKTTEDLALSDNSFCSGGYEWRLQQQNSADGTTQRIDIAPHSRDWTAAASGNNPRIYALLYKNLEWDGGESNTSKFPGEYEGTESIDEKNIVLWYESRPYWKEACEDGGSENCTSGFTTKARYLGGLDVYAETCSGSYVDGLAAHLYDTNNNLIQSGFTPMYVDVHTTGNYILKYNNYDPAGSLNYVFVKPEPVQPTPPVTGYTQAGWGGEVNLSLSSTGVHKVSGVYNDAGGTSCPTGSTGSIDVKSIRIDTGAQITGMYMQLTDLNNNQLGQGWTHHVFSNLTPASYKVWANDYCDSGTGENRVFNSWSDGTTTRDITVSVTGGQTSFVTARYDITTC